MIPKILFIVLPGVSATNGVRPYGSPHIGVAYLMSYLKQRGISAEVVDVSLDYANRDNLVVSAIDEYQPDLIGISLFTNIAHEGVRMVKMLKKQYSVPIVAGGPHISCTREDFLRKAPADYGIIKEGEKPLFNLIKALFIDKTPEAICRIPGLICRDASGDFVVNENTDLIIDLDSIPFPDLLSFGIEKYGFYKSRHYTILTSRGCPYACSYCAAPVCTGRRFRTRSVENILEEMEFWIGKGFVGFGIFDDAFNQDLARAKEFCRRLIDKGWGVPFDLYNGMRANMVDQELFDLLKDAGCTFVGFGMESGNDEILKKIGKHLTKQQLLKAIELSNGVGIPCAVNFILGHPGETPQTAQDTLDFAKSLNCAYVNIYTLVPYPGTRSYDILKSGNAHFFYDEDYYLADAQLGTGASVEPIFETPEFKREDRIRLFRAGMKLRRKTMFRFRFGKVLGFLLYLFFYNDRIFNFFESIRESEKVSYYYRLLRRNA